ncbi:hypothetical protein ATO11_16200 [Pseudaestuariivita atlantica]|uniref:Bile acid:sodium symporter n=2 Tax=Pseudaestuariivita atlantica TaxID=1317121 RepID=A0A0L1JMR6_9RHOB|nr:hypothetical protein ATO11_16200 [Pseudaestuariivita atlantica]
MLIARQARWVLVAGLVAGIAFPSVAAVLTPWLRWMVLAILALTAFRIGPGLVAGLGRVAGRDLSLVLGLQLVLPLLVIAVAGIAGVSGHPLTLSLVLMLAAPSIMSAPALCQMLGGTGARAMGLLVLGSIALPVTVVPVLWLAFGGAGFVEAVRAALLLALIVGGAVGAGLVLRHLSGAVGARALVRVDAANALLLAVFVVALMPAVAATWSESPVRLLSWLGAAFAANIGVQLVAWRWSGSVDVAVVAGNRNMSLFLVALDPVTMAPVLAFLGCYQIPMFLTPLLMARVYQKERG